MGVLFRMYSWGESWFHLSFVSAFLHSLSGLKFWWSISLKLPLCADQDLLQGPWYLLPSPEPYFSCDLGCQRANSPLSSVLTLPLQTLLVTFCVCEGKWLRGKRGRKEKCHVLENEFAWRLRAMDWMFPSHSWLNSLWKWVGVGGRVSRSYSQLSAVLVSQSIFEMSYGQGSKLTDLTAA